MLFGGLDLYFNQADVQKSIEFFTPTDKGPKTELVDLELIMPHSSHTGVRLPSSDVLVISCGSSATSAAHFKTVERINKYANQTTFAPKISSAIGGSAAVIGDTVYLCGGITTTHLKVCEHFHDGKWIPGVPMLVGRYSFGLVAIDQWLYAIGGGVENQEFTAEKYSLTYKAWQYIAPMPKPRKTFNTGVLDGSIYVCGSFNFFYPNDKRGTLSCDRYLPDTNTWQVMKEKMNVVHAIPSPLIPFNGRLFGFGGETNSSDNSTGRYVESYDAVTGSWTHYGETIKIRAYSVAVMTSYEGNIPSTLWKHNFNEFTNSVGNYTLNVSSLRPAKVMDEEPGQIPMFIEKSDKPVDDGCACGPDTIELVVPDESKTLQSPGYPKQYCNYHQCLWTISTAKSEYNLTVSLIWLAFSTENQMDMLYIYDEFGLLEVCTGSSCANHKSRGNTLFVYFQSDHVTTDIGFSAEVTAIDPDPCYCSESMQVILSSPDESFTLESPNYPKPYCPNHNCAWNLSVPIDLLIRVNWKRFSLSHGHTFNIFTSKKLLNNCTGEHCENVQTSENELYLQFRSNSHVSNDGVFSALITVLLSYCKKINVPPVGIMTYYREPRVDGNMPVGSVATLFCPEGFKITDTRQDTSSNTACLAPDWNERPTCTQVCKVNSTFESYELIHICDYGSGIQTNLVTVGQEISVDEYSTSNTKLSSSVFSCSHVGWHPQTPTCHRIAILIRCDIKAYTPIMGSPEYKDQRNLLLYYPLEKTTTVLEMQLEFIPDDIWGDDFVTIALDDGRRVLVVGESIGCWMIDLQLGTITNTTAPFPPRQNAAAARLAGQIYLCGGTELTWYDSLATCQVWINEGWQLLDAEMREKRSGLYMVASSDALFVIGGGANDDRASLLSVERYALGTKKWEFVSPVKTDVYHAAAVHIDGMILLCGGLDGYHRREIEKCHKYVIAEDRWIVMASMNYKRQGFSLVALAGGVYAVGGTYTTYNSISYIPVVDVELYDIHHDRWSIEFELPIGKAYNSYDSALVIPVD